MKRTYIFSLLFIVIAVLLAAAPAMAAPPQPFYLEKVCDQPDNTCRLTYAEAPFDVLVGGKIYYYDHTYFENPAGIAKESAAVMLASADGQDTLVGSVSWVLHDGIFQGRYTIVGGTGALEGVHATGVVNVLSWDTATFALEGNYFVAP